MSEDRKFLGTVTRPRLDPALPDIGLCVELANYGFV
jgi:hypothetical protein